MLVGNNQIMNYERLAKDSVALESMQLKASPGDFVKELEVESYHDFETCSALRKEWDSFIEGLGGEIFLTYDWCRIWWKHYGKHRKLLIMVVRYRSEIVGLLPVFHEKIWLGFLCCKAIKIVGTDFTPVTVSFPVKLEFIEEVLECFRMHIEKEWKWDIINLGAIAGRYVHVSGLVDAARKVFPSSTVDMKEEGQQTYLRLQPDWESHIKTLSGKQRTNARRAFRDLEARKVNLTFSLVDEEELDKAFDEFVQMHQTYWRAQSKPGHFKAWPRAREFHRDEAKIHAERGRLRLLKIIFDGNVVAYEYFYKFGNTYCWFINGRSGGLYKSGFDFKWIALRAKLELAAKENVTLIDSMRGEYDYKVLMGGEMLPIRSVLIVPAGGVKALQGRWFRRFAWTLDVVYAKIWRRRIAPKIHYRVGFFLTTWIRSHVLSI